MDMLSFSKDRRPQRSNADANQLVTEVCDLMQAHADEIGVKIERRLFPDLPTTAFDAEAMHQAFLNLLVNALEALDGLENACVTVSTGFDANRDELVVEVADSGPGIPPEELPLLFNVFESSKGARGTGLGLPVSRKILREHGGDLIVASVPGKGATFRMIWPRHDAPQETAAASNGTAPNG
jgi:signal transduction histidine kinase